MTDNNSVPSGVILNAVEYAKIAHNTPVINLHQLGYKVHVHLPEATITDSELYRIDEIVPKFVEDVSYTGFITRECHKPWLDILVEWLNTSPGQHMYKLSFVNVKTDYVFSIYVSYIIQEDHPKQDYVYMEGQRNETNSSRLETI